MMALNDRFNEKLSTLSEENADSQIFDLGYPSPVLLAAGVQDNPLKLYGNKIIKKAKEHGYSITELRNLLKPWLILLPYSTTINKMAAVPF